ncbi:hypothetical protein EIK77_009964 [Talaromyces pinophilus]|nr:hypothetical protein EIK77_009964 [Talaromyces pinophilus]
MSTSAAPRTIVVVGASGNQGSGVVRALLNSKATRDLLWLVRGTTRGPNSAKAKKFLADHQTTDNRLTLVAGNVYDQASLQDTFADAYGVFAITSEYYPGRLLKNREDMQHEVEAGYNIVLAAEKCGIEHFVFSSLPDMPAIHDPISAEEFAEFAVPVVGPAFKEDAKEMMEWAAVMPADKICYGAFDTDQNEAMKILGLKATSFEDWLHRSNWKGPT